MQKKSVRTKKLNKKKDGEKTTRLYKPYSYRQNIKTYIPSIPTPLINTDLFLILLVFLSVCVHCLSRSNDYQQANHGDPLKSAHRPGINRSETYSLRSIKGTITYPFFFRECCLIYNNTRLNYRKLRDSIFSRAKKIPFKEKLQPGAPFMS